jgi:DNA-binding transcriptional LysR family regulator
MNSDMNLNLLRVFHAAAKASSFTRAAQEIHLTQPGISKHIKVLERHYGTRLFERIGKQVVLTQAGEILYRTTGDIFRLLNESKSRIGDLRGLCGGRLSIGASITIGTYILPEWLVAFRQKYPAVKLQLDIALSQQVVGKVLDNTLELGFVGHSEQDQRLTVTPFMTDQLVLILPPGHEWAERTAPVTLQELAAQPFLLARQGSGTRMVLEQLFASSGVAVREILEFGTTEGVKQAVAAGLAISILSKHVVAKELSSGTIVSLPLQDVDLKRELYLVHHKDRYLSAAAKAFLQVAELKTKGSRV